MNFKNLPAAAIAIVMVATSACAASGPDRSTGQVVDDSSITARVKAALIDEPATKARQIDVNVNRGVVELAGAVDTQAAKTKAGSVAQKVNGVREVRNNLTVGAPNRTAGEVIDDTVITARVKAALAANEVTKAYQINVDTREGIVELHGFVDSQNEANQAVQEARAVPGVSSVRSDLEVKPRN